MDTPHEPSQNSQPDPQDDLQAIWDAAAGGPPIDPRPAEGDFSAAEKPLYLLVAPRRALSRMIAVAAARLCLKGPVRVLDGGNLYDAHAVARQARALTSDLGEALGRIKIARAFTCYQVEALLAAQQPDPAPLLALDLLDTFADENAPLSHRNYLAQHLALHLQRLVAQAPVLVGLAPTAGPPVSIYLSWLERIATRTLRFERPAPPEQPALF